MHSSIYSQDALQEDFIEDQSELIELCDVYLNYFPDPLDSSKSLQDTLNVITDIEDASKTDIDVNNAILDSLIISNHLIIPNDTMDLKGALAAENVVINEPPENILINWDSLKTNSVAASMSSGFILSKLIISLRSGKRGFRDSCFNCNELIAHPNKNNIII